jgi:hypothetical protein
MGGAPAPRQVADDFKVKQSGHKGPSHIGLELPIRLDRVSPTTPGRFGKRPSLERTAQRADQAVAAATAVTP